MSLQLCPAVDCAPQSRQASQRQRPSEVHPRQRHRLPCAATSVWTTVRVDGRTQADRGTEDPNPWDGSSTPVLRHLSMRSRKTPHASGAARFNACRFSGPRYLLDDEESRAAPDAGGVREELGGTVAVHPELPWDRQLSVPRKLAISSHRFRKEGRRPSRVGRRPSRPGGTASGSPGRASTLRDGAGYIGLDAVCP